MNYPQNLKKGDTIGICAPSGGIVKPEKIQKLEMAKENLKKLGYKIIETESVRKEEKGRSTTGAKRAEEFMQLLENDEVKLIIFASGGDFLIDMLDYLDFEKLKKIKPKWMQGYSDITTIEFLFTTILEIPSMYYQTIKDYSNWPLERNLIDALRIESGEKILQKSFKKCEKASEVFKLEEPMLTEKVYWNNLTGQKRIEMQGRAIGGCLDSLKVFFGTKYDNILKYIEKYKTDGIIWFLECFEMSTPELYRILWQMKNAGYFKFCRGIIFGRPLFIRNDYDITFNEAVYQILKETNIPIICDADIGHVSPQLAITNGAILKIVSENGKGTIETFLD